MDREADWVSEQESVWLSAAAPVSVAACVALLESVLVSALAVETAWDCEMVRERVAVVVPREASCVWLAARILPTVFVRDVD